MEIEAPYLQAIQLIDGKTPGEKQRTINIIARQLAQNADNDSQIPGVPDALKPLVRVEVAKILHRYEGIVEALKSEDMTVVSRALQARWFFEGSDSSLVDVRHFLENVFPEISLYARLKIVKNFGIYLKNTAVAENLFLTVAGLYGVSQAVPLLNACEEDFAFKMIVENEVVLSERTVKALYRKYPDLVIKYLKLGKRGDDDIRNLYHINLADYVDFLPEIANNRFNDFMEIYKMHDAGYLNVQLGKKAANVFVKTQVDLLVANPRLYIGKLVSLKTVTQKLSADDFTNMFKNLYPAKKENFRYSDLNTYLQYYKPERERVPLILNTFRRVYGRELLSCKDLVDSSLMAVLPAEDRVKQARLKLADDKDWHYYDLKNSWRCYLPTGESVPAITKEIAKSSDAANRGQLLKQLIYTSKVNDDKDALLKLLNYIYDRHRNDQKYVFYSCLSEISMSFDFATVSSNHWEVLNKYIKLAEMQSDLINEVDTVSTVIEAALHYCVLNDLPFDNYFRILVDIDIQIYHRGWNILTKYLNLERRFMDLFMEVVPKQYPFDSKIWEDNELNIIESLASSLWKFNEHNKNSNSKLKNLYVRDYQWLLQKIKAYVTNEKDENYYTKFRLLKLMRENERELYDEFIGDLDKFWAFDIQVIVDVLRRQPERVLENWKECLKEIRSTVDHRQPQSSFIIKSRWYQDLPIKFFNESLGTFNDPEACVGSIVILALLTEGETYAKIIEPFVPTDENMDTDHPEAKNTYDTLLAIASNLRKVNPPVSLDIIARFCVGDYLQMALRSLTSVCRRVPVAKVIPFAKTLTNRRVSVMKHGIRLMYLVAPLEEIYTFLTDLWNREGHTSIRSVVFIKIYDLFCKQPNSSSWRMIRMCLDNLNTNDDEEILKSLSSLCRVPNEYLYGYIKSVLTAMKSMEEKSEDPRPYINSSCNLIRNIDGPVTKILPEEYTQELIKQHLFVFDYSPHILESGMHLAVNSYLLASKEYNELRFKFFGDFFKDSVVKYWDKTHPTCYKFYPMNFMAHKFFAGVCNVSNVKCDVRIFESLLAIFQSALKPNQDAGSYLDLVYIIEFNKSNTSVDFGTRIAQKIPGLIEIFTPECVFPMAQRLSSFIKYRSFSDSESRQEKLLAIIEVLANHGTTHCAFVAAHMLFDNESKELNRRHKAVVHTLRNFHHPGIFWILNERLATNNFCADNNDA